MYSLPVDYRFDLGLSASQRMKFFRLVVTKFKICTIKIGHAIVDLIWLKVTLHLMFIIVCIEIFPGTYGICLSCAPGWQLLKNIWASQYIVRVVIWLSRRHKDVKNEAQLLLSCIYLQAVHYLSFDENISCSELKKQQCVIYFPYRYCSTSFVVILDWNLFVIRTWYTY